MKIYRSLRDVKPCPRSIAIGIFDGVHRGHQAILGRMLEEARRLRARSMVVTFDPDPMKVLKPRVPHPILISLAHRLRFFEKLGVEETLVVRFDRRFSKIPHEIFLNKVLLEKLKMRSLTVGHDFCFGNGARGTTGYLEEKSRETGFGLTVQTPLKSGREVISSTRIRRLVETGNLKKAEKMLGRPVSVYGTVIRGRGRGVKVGFPTANLDPHHETLPPQGVYAAYGYLDHRRLKGVINVGPRPTFGDSQKSLEVHFIDFHKNIYGREVELIFLSYLRGVKRFTDAAALKQAIARDIEKSKTLYKTLSSR